MALVINESAVTRMAACLCVGLLMGGFGCASLAAERARTESLGRQLDVFRYAEPLDDVWQHARLLLAERGYPLADADAKAVGQSAMNLPVRIFSPARETSTTSRRNSALIDNTHADPVEHPQSLDTGWNTYWKRYHVEANVAANGCRVIFTRLEREHTDRQAESSRDLELELELVRRVDPVSAARIEAQLAPHER